MNIYQLRAGLSTLRGLYMQNVWMYQLSEGGTATPDEYAKELIDAWRAANEINFLLLFPDQVRFNIMDAKRVSGGGGVSISVSVAVNGNQVDTISSAAMAADIAWLPSTPENRQGRTYIGALGQLALDNDVLSGGQIAALNTFAAVQVSQLTLAGGLGTADFGVLTRKTGAFTIAANYSIKAKPTALNKRTVPYF